MEVVIDSKQLERSKTSESLLRLLLDSLPAFISYIDSQQRYVFANALYASFFGRPLSEVIGREVREVLGDEAYENTRYHIQAGLNGNRQSYEYKLLRAGKSRWLKVVYVPHVEKGKVKGIFVLGLDVTEQKQLEQKLHEKTLVPFHSRKYEANKPLP